MVQEFHVVRCFSCSTFQSQQVRKDKKFSCKICGAKQSVKKEYGRGSGKDCRIHVQKLNNLKGSLQAEQEQTLEAQLEEEEEEIIEHEDAWMYGCPTYSQEFSGLSYEADTGLYNQDGYNKPGNEGASKSLSKWSTFLTSDSDDLQNEAESAPVHTGRPVSSDKKHGDRDFQSSSVLLTTHSDCKSVRKSTLQAAHSVRTELPSRPPVEEKQLPVHRDLPKQNIGPVRMHKRYSIESQDIADRNLHCGPYRTVGGVSGPSRLAKVTGNDGFDSRSASSLLATNSIQSSIDEYRMGSDNHSGKSTGTYQPDSVTGRHKSTPLPKQCEDSKHSGTSQENDFFLNKVIPDAKSNIPLFKSKQNHEQNKLMGEHDAGILNANTEVQNKVELKCENANMKKQNDFVSCLENKTSAALKKYELSDDIDDIDFEF